MRFRQAGLPTTGPTQSDEMRSQCRHRTDERDLCKQHPRQAYFEKTDTDGPHDSNRGDLRHSIADASANRAVGRNQCPGDSDIDDAGKNRREDDIALALSALQKALDGREKCLWHAEQRGNGHDHGRARVPGAIEKEQRRNGQSHGDEMERNGREDEIAERRRHQLRHLRFIAPKLNKNGSAGGGTEDGRAEEQIVAQAEGDGIERNLPDVGYRGSSKAELRISPKRSAPATWWRHFATHKRSCVCVTHREERVRRVPAENARHCGEETDQKVDAAHEEQRGANPCNAPMENHRRQNRKKVDEGGDDRSGHVCGKVFRRAVGLRRDEVDHRGPDAEGDEDSGEPELRIGVLKYPENDGQRGQGRERRPGAPKCERR